MVANVAATPTGGNTKPATGEVTTGNAKPLTTGVVGVVGPDGGVIPGAGCVMRKVRARDTVGCAATAPIGGDDIPTTVPMLVGAVDDKVPVVAFNCPVGLALRPRAVPTAVAILEDDDDVSNAGGKSGLGKIAPMRLEIGGSVPWSLSDVLLPRRRAPARLIPLDTRGTGRSATAAPEAVIFVPLGTRGTD